MCNRFKEGICTKENENLFIVQRKERRSEGVYSGADKKGVYSTVKVTTDGTNICRKERWEEKEGTRLLVS